MTDQEVLDIKFRCDDLNDVVTVRQYMQQLLEALIEEEEGFSGKRPFGNSGWMCDLERALVVGGAVSGTITYYDENTEDEYVEACADDYTEVKRVLYKAIAAL